MNPIRLDRARLALRPLNRRHGWVVESADRYHGCPARWNAGLGSSDLKQILRSPAHFLETFLSDTPAKPSPAMRFGTLAHGFILENRIPVVKPDLHASSKAYKDWLENQPDPGAICTADELEALQRMRLSVNEALGAAGLSLERAEVEVSGYASEGAYDFELRIRPDARFEDEGIILDLKTTGDADPAAFARTAWNLGYHVQAAFYLNVSNLIAGEERYREFWWAAVECDAPHDVTLHRATPAMIQAGGSRMLQALASLHACLEEGAFPGRQRLGEIHDLAPPAWAKEGGGA